MRLLTNRDYDRLMERIQQLEKFERERYYHLREELETLLRYLNLKIERVPGHYEAVVKK